MRHITVDTRADAATAAATIVAAIAAEAGPTSIALAGGSATLATLSRLVHFPDIDWSTVDVLQADERLAPAGHPDRSWESIEALLTAHSRAHAAGRHPVPVTADAASRYSETVNSLCVTGGAATVALLGLGVDAHVASLLPGGEGFEETAAFVATGPHNGLMRVTGTVDSDHCGDGRV